MRSNAPRIALIVFLLIGVVTLGAVFAGSYFRVGRVVVLGCEQRSPTEVVELAAIENGQSYFKLSLKEIREKIDVHPYFEVLSIGFRLPDQLRIQVKERRQAAYVEVQGKNMVINETGIVLEMLSAVPENKIPLVTGYPVTAEPIPGKVLGQEQKEDKETGQSDALHVILAALHAQGATQLIEQINIERVSDLWMTTRSGFEVRLGNFENMDDKIHWLKSVEPILVSEGYKVGKINVSTGKNASFMPSGLAPQDPNAEEDEPATQDEADTLADILGDI